MIKIILLTFILIGCRGKSYYSNYRNNCETTLAKKRINFILECIKNANSKSDGEPEDWLHICQNIAEDTYCKKEKYFYYYEGFLSSKRSPNYSCKIAKDSRAKEVCR